MSDVSNFLIDRITNTVDEHCRSCGYIIKTYDSSRWVFEYNSEIYVIFKCFKISEHYIILRKEYYGEKAVASSWCHDFSFDMRFDNSTLTITCDMMSNARVNITNMYIRTLLDCFKKVSDTYGSAITVFGRYAHSGYLRWDTYATIEIDLMKEFSIESLDTIVKHICETHATTWTTT